MTKQDVTAVQLRRFWHRGIVLLAGFWALVGGIQGCGGSTPAPVTPEPPTTTEPPTTEPPPATEVVPVDKFPPECRERHRVELILGELAVNILDVYGRIDSEIFSPPRPGKVELQAGKLRPRNEAKLGDLRAAIDKLNANEIALAHFQTGREKALEACKKAGCARKQFTFDVKKEELPDGGAVYRWTVKDDVAPTETDWNEVFLKQYSATPSPECKKEYLPALRVPDPEDPAKGALLVTGEEKGLASQRSGVRSGAAYLSGPCEDGNVTSCNNSSCERDDDTVSKWHNYGRSKCCVGC